FVIVYGIHPRKFQTFPQQHRFTGNNFAFLICRCCVKYFSIGEYDVHRVGKIDTREKYLSSKLYVHVYAFPCTTILTCKPELELLFEQVIQNGRAIIWFPTIIDNRAKLQSSYSQKIDIFGKVVNQTLFLNLVEYFLMQGINLTGISKGKNVHTKNCPSIFKSVLEAMSKGLDITVVSTGRSLPYKFFTPDGVYVAKESISLFTSPFEPSVWLCIICSCCICSLVYSIGGNLIGSNDNNDWVFITLKFLRVLLEQSYMKRQRRFLGVIFGTWLVASFIFLNCYRGVLKTEFSVGRTQSKWKYLEEIISFKTITILRKFFCSNYNENLYDLYSAKESISKKWNDLHHFTHFPIFDFYRALGRKRDEGKHLNGFMKKDKLFGGSRKQREFLNGIATKSEQFGESGQQNAYLLCENRIQNFVRNANGTEYAFIARADTVKFYQETLKHVKGLSLGDNLKVEDNYLRFSNVFGISSAMEGKHHRWISGRMKMLVESGIYWFWERLQEIRLPTYRIVSMKVDAEKPLSFSGSCMELVFYLFLFSMLFHVVVFAAEYILFYFGRNLVHGVLFIQSFRTFVQNFQTM
ncbi:unnamed protein product, partial [Allacma fusca]